MSFPRSLQASLPVVRQQPKMIFLWGVFFHGTRYSNWQQPKNVFGVENCTPRRENIDDDLREASWKYSTILVSRFYVPSIGSTLKFRSCKCRFWYTPIVFSCCHHGLEWFFGSNCHWKWTDSFGHKRRGFYASCSGPFWHSLYFQGHLFDACRWTLLVLLGDGHSG